jgi:hypothetical protein
VIGVASTRRRREGDVRSEVQLVGIESSRRWHGRVACGARRGQKLTGDAFQGRDTGGVAG